jgi:transitional endoplasmic reticulum ATPase
MNQPDDSVLAALKGALDRDPGNGPLWIHYADLLRAAGRPGEASAALRSALEKGADEKEAVPRLLPLLRETGSLAEALIRAEKFLAGADALPVRLELARILLARGDAAGALEQYLAVLRRDPALKDPALEALRGAAPDRGSAAGTDGKAPAREETPEPPAPPGGEAGGEGSPGMAGVVPEPPSDDELARQFQWEDLRTTFADVAGLDDVKKQIHLRIIAPFKSPEIYKAFRRKGGGGILLYGPPGCGKTFVARATAGECGARFVVVGIHEVVDKYWGESEKVVHALFEEARRRAPTVLFFDEFDALGASRGRTDSQFWRTLVDQLLQEMDGVGGRNEDILVFAATNVPWNVDPAFRRPGRFDRLLFVPPPDERARAEILGKTLEKMPGGDGIPIDRIARATALMTGADLKALCERASDRALSRSLETGTIHPVSTEDFEKELKGMVSSASEWFATAKNYARYSNEGGQYDELVDFLKKVKRW